MASKKELTILLRARNAMAAGLSSAGKSLKAFGKRVFNIGKKAVIGISAIGTVLAGVAVKVISAYATQEKAEKGLAAALRAHGDEVENNLKLLKQHAAAIQDETGAGDESTLAIMSRLRMLGVETAALGDAARGVLALKSAGMEGEMAARALALAHQGNYTALSRYLPKLRAAKTESEKAAIVNDFLTKGYAKQKEELNTVSGSWTALKGRIGDALENIGEAIVKTGIVQRVLLGAAKAAKRFGDRIAEWTTSDQFTRLKDTIVGISDAIAEGGEPRSEAMTAMANVLKAAFAVAAEKAIDALKKAAPTIGRMIGAGAKAVMGKLTTDNDEIKLAAYQLGIERKTNGWRAGFSRFMGSSELDIKREARGFEGFNDEQRKAIKIQIALNRQKEIFKDLGIETTETIEGETAAEVALAKAIEAANAVADKYRKNKEEIGVNAPPPPSPPAADPIVVAQENEAKRLAELRKQELADKKAFIEKQIALDEKRLAAAEELAAKTVAAYIEEARAKENAAKALIKDQEKADKLRKRQALGAKLSRRDREFLDAADKIKAAQQLVPKGQVWLKKLNEELVATGERQEELLKGISAMLKENLTLDGGE